MRKRKLGDKELVPFLRGKKSKGEINELFLQNAGGYKHNEVNDVLRGELPVRVEQGLEDDDMIADPELEMGEEALDQTEGMPEFNEFLEQGGVDEGFILQVIDRAREMGRNELADELEMMLDGEEAGGEIPDPQADPDTYE